MRKQNTKHSLVMSVISLLLCFSMLLGTTFAWFTDSVTSTGNKIQAGSLKVDLELRSSATDTWKSVKEDKTPIFNYNNWEPGYVDAKLLKIDNEGTLALKWMAKLISENELSALANVIDVYVLPYGVLADDTTVAYPTRELAGYTKVGTVAEFVNTIEQTTNGTLEAGQSAYLGIAVKMQESAGNEYQGMDLGAFDIQIVATQLAFEEDSFDNQYDKFADYDGEISTISALEAALTKGGTYKLLSDIAVAENSYLEIPDNVTVALDLNGKTITGGNDLSVLKKGIIVNNGNLTLAGGGEIKITADNAYSVIDNNGTLTLEDVKIDSTNYDGTNGVPMYAIRSMNNLIVNDGAVVNGLRTIAVNGGTATFNGGEITTVAVNQVITVHTVYVYGSATVTFNGGTFKNMIPATYASASGAATICDASTGAIVINGGYFESQVSDYLTLHDYGFGGPVISVTGGTFKFKPAANKLASGSVVNQNANGTYTVTDYIPYDKNTHGDLYTYLPTLNSGDTLVLPAGTYTTTGTFTVAAGVTIKGEAGKEVIIRQESSAQDDIFNCAGDVVIENITFESNRKGYAITDNTKNHDTDGDITVINCKFKGIAIEKNYGIYKNLNGNLTIKNCTFDNYNNAICGVNNGNGSTTTITGCTFTNINGEAVGYVASTVPADFEANAIANNTGLTAENVIGY